MYRMGSFCCVCHAMCKYLKLDQTRPAGSTTERLQLISHQNQVMDGWIMFIL